MTPVTSRCNTPVTRSCVTVVSMRRRALRTERFLLLVEQLSEEHGSPHAAMLALKVNPSYLSNLQREEHRDVGADVMARAQKALGLQSRWFHDRSLGESPNYHDFLGSEPELESEAHPAVDAYIARELAEGRPVSEAHQRELRSVRMAQGPDALTIEVVEGIHRGLRARDAMRELRRPDLSKELDDAAGERKLPPAKKRTR